MRVFICAKHVTMQKVTFSPFLESKLLPGEQSGERSQDDPAVSPGAGTGLRTSIFRLLNLREGCFSPCFFKP